MLFVAFLLCIAFAAITWPFFDEARLAVTALIACGIFIVGLGLSEMFGSGGYCGTLLFRVLTIYIPGWTSVLMLARIIYMAGRPAEGATPQILRSARRGLLWLVAICIFGLVNLIAIANDPMVESRTFEYNGQRYVGTLIGLSTDPVIYDDLGPLVCREVDLPYDSPLYHKLAHAYWEAR